MATRTIQSHPSALTNIVTEAITTLTLFFLVTNQQKVTNLVPLELQPGSLSS